MATPQDTDVMWISVKDLRKTKLCKVCHQPMTIKQVNLIEACRACYNPHCSPQLMDVPDIEFIQRSYMDIPEKVERTKRDLEPKTISLEDEIDKFTKLFSEVESIVSHRLREDYWTISDIPSSSRKKSEGSKGLNFSEEPSVNKCKFLDGCLERSGEVTPKWLLEQPVISNVVSLKADIAEEQPFEICRNPRTEESISTYTEQVPSSNTVLDASHSTHANESEKLSDLPVSYVDLTQNELWQHSNVVEIAATDIGTILPAYNTVPDFGPSKDNIFSEVQAMSLNTPIDVKDNLLVSIKGVSVADTCSNFDAKSSEVLEDKPIPSELMPAGDFKKSLSDTSKKENTKNFKIEVEADSNFSVKITNGFRCYPPRKRCQRASEAKIETKTFLNSNLLEKECPNISFSPDSESSLSHPDDELIVENGFGKQGIEGKESKFGNDYGTGTHLERISPPSTALSFDPVRFMVVPDENGVTKVIDLNQNTCLNSPGPGKSSDKLAFEGSIHTKSSPKGGKMVSPVPTKIGSVSRTKTSFTDMLRGNGKPVLGFNELKSFGGVKSSLMTAEAKSNQRPRKRRVLKKAETQSKIKSKTGGITESNSININDVIENVIADMQQSSEGENIQWNQMFSDFKIS